MPQIPASLPTDAASIAVNKDAPADASSAGAFTAVLLGVSAQGQGAAPQAAAVTADAQGDAENKSAAAAINAAVMETIARQQKAANGLLQADATSGTGAGGAGVANGKGQGLAAAPGQTGATPANGAPPPGLAGAMPGQAGKGEAVAGGQGTPANAAQAAAAGAAIKPDGMPTGAPTTDAHAARNAEAAIKAGALQDPKGGANAMDALSDDAAAMRSEPRSADAPRPVPATEPMPPNAADALSRGPGSGQTAALAGGESQTAVQQTASASAAATHAGTDQMQPGTAAQPRPVMPAQPVAEQVAVHIQRAAAEGLDRIMIHLNPPELGRVDVKLEFGHDGRVQAIISADNPDALDTLRNDARALERALADAGVKSDPGTLQFQLRGESRGGGHDQANGGNTGTPGAAPEDADLPEDAALARPAEWQDGLVDIRV